MVLWELKAMIARSMRAIQHLSQAVEGFQLGMKEQVAATELQSRITSLWLRH